MLYLIGGLILEWLSDLAETFPKQLTCSSVYDDLEL